ncbi:hypothetical protein GAR05_00693 [Micromonospora saelicesensis]|uniref:Uncharacterized protein n=1 Tax=Micromonospora saelicesensis TaxID=285676 RepID=A0ABX9CP42_9ACTN|nr:hypothetical protein GAR05_00693 [Micromonospora saelicesensis]
MPQSHNALRAIALRAIASGSITSRSVTSRPTTLRLTARPTARPTSRPTSSGPAASEPLLWDEVPTTPRPQRPLRVGRTGGGV